MERHQLPRTMYTYNAMINMHGFNGDVPAAEACYRDAAAAGVLDVVTVSSMLGLYDHHELVRAHANDTNRV